MIKRGFFFSRTEEIMQVNVLNQRIGKLAREKMSKETHFRTCNMFLFDTNGKLFVQKRPEHIVPYPGYWDAAPGGVVRINETDLQAIMREISEEMGIVPVNVLKLSTISIENQGWFWWTSFFKGHCNSEITISKDVEEYRLMDLEEIAKRVQAGENFTPGCLRGLSLIENTNNKNRS